MGMNKTENNLYAYLDHFPRVAEDVFIAPGARVIGRVEIATQASIWYNCVVRGDVDFVRIGTGTNIQDGSVLHEDEGFPLIIGDRVTVGHNAILHGCTIGDGAFVGMGAIILSGAAVGPGAVVAAGALVLQGQQIPAGSLALGSPAKVVRELSREEISKFQSAAERYCKRTQEYLSQMPG